MKKELRILIIEGNHEESVLLKDLLEKSLLVISSINVVQTLKQANTEIQNLEFDIIFIDLELPDSAGMNTLFEILQYSKLTAVVVFSGLEDKKIGLEAVNIGAQDYLVKGLLNSDMLSRIVNYSMKRKQAERLVNDSAQKWESTFNSITDIIAVISKDHEILEINQAGCKSLGMEKTDIIGKKCYKLIHKLNSPLDGCPCTKVLNTKQMEITEISEAGRSYLLTAWPITNENGEVTSFSHSIKDITECKLAEEKLKVSEERFRQVAESSGELFWEIDTNGVYTFVSSDSISLLGYHSKEIVGKKHFYDFFLPDEKKELRTTAFKVFAKKESFKKFENRNLHKNGHVVIVETSAYPILDENDKLLGYRGVDKDISERKLAEEALQKSEKRLRSFFENAIMGMYRTTVQGDILSANPALLKMLGYSCLEELKTRNLEKEGHEPGYERSNFKEKLEKNGKVVGLESAWTRKDGSIVFIRENAIAKKDDENNLLYYEGTVEDITERKQTEKALEESEEYFRTLIENSTDVISILDDKGIITYESPSHEKVLGYETGKLIGENVFGLVHPDDRERISMQFVKLLKRSNEIEQVNFRFLHKDGTWIYIEGTGTNLLSSSKIKGIVVNYRDITDRKLAEKKLKISEFRFRELVNTINSGVAVYKVINEGKSGADYIIQDFNKAALAMESLTLDDVVGKSLLDLRPTIDEYGLIPTFQQVWKTGKQTFFPAKQYVDNKYSSYYENQVYKLPNGEIVAVYDDITKQENAVLKVAESQERFDLAMKATKDGLWDFDLVTNDVYYSPNWKIMLGYEDNELLNDFSTWEKLTDPEDENKAMEMQQKLINKQIDHYEIEFKMKHKDGHWVDILSRAEAFFDDSGKAIRIIGTHVDITERKKAEIALAETEARYATSFENSRDGINVFRKDKKIIAVNKELIKLSCYTKDELLSMQLDKLFQEANTTETDDRMNQMQSGENLSLFEASLITKQGNTIPVELNVTSLKNSYGYDVVFQGNVRDITERKKAEELLKQRMSDLEIFNDATVDREIAINELRKEINDLLVKAGKEAKYEIVK